MTHTTNAGPAMTARYHADDPDIRILHRVPTLGHFPLAERNGNPVRTVAVVDVETTGTDPLVDEIIDVAVVILEVDARGEIVGIVSSGQALRDPGVLIPAAITQLTGITNEDVHGKSIDLDALEHRLASADVRLAHNARFDIAFLQNLMPGLAGAAWACSAADFNWLSHGFDGRKLTHLLTQIDLFNNAHRAMADVVSLISLVAHRLPHGGTVIRDLLENAERPTVKFEATNAPFERRSLLKARGYRWDALRRVWWIELASHECAGEERWFRAHISAAGPMPRMTPVTWHQRHR